MTRPGLLPLGMAIVALALLGPATPGTSQTASPAANVTTVRIDSKQIEDKWVSTGVRMHKDETWKLTATGRINYCGGSPDPNDNVQPQCDSTPDGSVSGEGHCGGPALCGALIGRFAGTTTEFPVGSRKIFKDVAGTLELQVNDFGDPSNNEGSYTAKIRQPHATIAGRVVDGRGHGIPGARIKAKGPADLSASTNFEGFYSIDVPNNKHGKYVVTPHNDEQRFQPEQRRVDLDRNSRAEANFTGLCRAKPRGRTAQGFRPPANGLYREQGSAVEAYYSCANSTVRAQILALGVTCTDGREALVGGAVRNALTAGKAELSSRSFAIDQLHRDENLYEISGGRIANEPFGRYDVRAKVAGDFKRTGGDDLVDTRYSVRAHPNKSGMPSCAGAGRANDLRLADRDPSPFD